MKSVTSFAVLTVFVASSFFGSGAVAETWTDASGKFKVDAKYHGVKGKNLMLMRPDGKVVSVPIARLSADSKALAKKLYELEKQSAMGKGATGNETSSATAIASSSYDPTEPFEGIEFPTPPSTPPMKPFPENPTLEEQKDYLIEQTLAGHPEAFWYVLPADMREQLNSAEFREIIAPSAKQMMQQQQPLDGAMKKIVKILLTKKDVMMGSAMLQSNPAMHGALVQAYDPAAGVICELISVNYGMSGAMADVPMEDIVTTHLSRIGAHAKGLLPLAPPGMVENFTSSIVVSQTGDSEGTITVTNPTDGTSQSMEMSVYQGRWLPKELVAAWNENKSQFLDLVRKQAEESIAQQQQGQAMVGMIALPLNDILDQILDADTPEAFDKIITEKILPMAAMFAPQAPPGR